MWTFHDRLKTMGLACHQVHSAISFRRVVSHLEGRQKSVVKLGKGDYCSGIVGSTGGLMVV